MVHANKRNRTLFFCFKEYCVLDRVQTCKFILSCKKQKHHKRSALENNEMNYYATL